jgi:hypothetical protein
VAIVAAVVALFLCHDRRGGAALRGRKSLPDDIDDFASPDPTCEWRSTVETIELTADGDANPFRSTLLLSVNIA